MSPLSPEKSQSVSLRKAGANREIEYLKLSPSAIFVRIIFVLLLCWGWGYIHGTVLSRQRAELYHDARYNIPKMDTFMGWAYYDQANNVVTFHLGNSGREEVDFGLARYFIVSNRWFKEKLELNKMRMENSSGQSEGYILKPFRGEFGLFVRCEMPVHHILFKKYFPRPERIRGFEILLADGRTIPFGYEDLNYLQTIKRFIRMKIPWAFHGAKPAKRSRQLPW